MRRISIVLGSVLLSCSGLLWAQQCSSAPQPAPILAGRAEHGLPGKAQGTERWIVQFATRSFDLQAFRTAIDTLGASLAALLTQRKVVEVVLVHRQRASEIAVIRSINPARR